MTSLENSGWRQPDPEGIANPRHLQEVLADARVSSIDGPTVCSFCGNCGDRRICPVGRGLAEGAIAGVFSPVLELDDLEECFRLGMPVEEAEEVILRHILRMNEEAEKEEDDEYEGR